MNEEIKMLIMDNLIELRNLFISSVKSLEDRINDISKVVNNHGEALTGIKNVMEEYSRFFLGMEKKNEQSE